MVRSKKTIMTVSIVVFIALQAIKPLLVIFIYKEITNFHPTIVNNYEIYKMVMENIYHGSMNPIYTITFIISEILFLTFPIVLYRKLSSKKYN